MHNEKSVNIIERYYIAVNTGVGYPLTYTGYFSEALYFSDIVDAYLYIEKHGLEKLATVIKRY